MVYVDRDGRILERQPWTFWRGIGVFVALFSLIIAFFRTLLAPLFGDDNNEKHGISSRWFGGGGGGGGSGGSGWGNGGGRGPGNGGFGPNKRIGRINTAPECNIPGGGCSGGGCSR